MRCFNCHIAILYVQMVDTQRKIRMAILGRAPGIAIYCHCENLMQFSPNNQILSTFHRSFSLQSIDVLQASTERKKAFCFQ